MTKVVVSAKNLDLAIMRAASALSTPRGDVAHRVTEENRGFLGLGKKITIEAWKQRRGKGSHKKNRENSELTRGEEKKRSQRGRRAPTEELSAQQIQEIVEGLKDYLTKILWSGFGVSANIQIKEDFFLEGSRYIFNIDSPEFGQLISSERSLPDSLEHLMRKQPRHIKRELPFKIFVDADSCRLKREQDLLAHAKETAEEVVRTEQSVMLEYESAYERKIIHLALRDDERVYSKSVGPGANKKLKVSLSQEEGDSSIA